MSILASALALIPFIFLFYFLTKNQFAIIKTLRKKPLSVNQQGIIIKNKINSVH